MVNEIPRLFSPARSASGARIVIRGARREFTRGDVNLDTRIDLTDAVVILRFLFLGVGGPLPCEDAADIDDDGRLNVTDGIALLGSLFLGTRPPSPPHPGCGLDPSSDQLDCVQTRCAGAGAP